MYLNPSSKRYLEAERKRQKEAIADKKTRVFDIPLVFTSLHYLIKPSSQSH